MSEEEFLEDDEDEGLCDDLDEDEEEEEEELEEPDDEYDLEEIESDVKINRYRLDEEQEVQAQRFLKYASMLAEAKDERDRCKEHLSYMQGYIELAYRKEPPEDIKVTDSTIKALVASDPAVREAEDILRTAQSRVNELEADVEAMQHRRSQLKNLTQLWIGGYFSVPGQTREDASTGVRENLGRRGREMVEEDYEEGEEE